MRRLLVYMLLSLLAVVGNASAITRKPWVIAHRGSSGDYPELTMKAFKAGVEDGADMLELDTAVTRDHRVIVLHEPDMSVTTNVADMREFDGRKRSDTIYSDGYSKNVTDYFTWDFTLDEVQRLRKTQRMSFRESRYNLQESVPTLKDTVQLVKRLDAERKPGQRRVVLLIEVKLCRYFTDRTNRSTEELVVAELVSEGVSERPDLIHLQTFELECAAELKRRLPMLPVYKLEQSAGISDAKLTAWRRDLRLDGIGVDKSMVAAGSADPAGSQFTYKYRVTGTTDLVERAHRLDPNFKVFVWTLRNEDRYIAWGFGQDGTTEAAFFAEASVDGLITDFPKTVRRFVDSSCVNAGVSVSGGESLAALMATIGAVAAAAIGQLVC